MTKKAIIITLALKGLRPAEIAQQANLNVYTVYQALRHARNAGVNIPRYQGGRTPHDPNRPMQEIRMLVDPDVAKSLKAEADRRGIQQRQLIRQVLTAVTEDDLFGAVLEEDAA
jgi:transposase